MLSYIQHKKCLPGTWFIQLDNTVKYVFAILFVITVFCKLVPFPGWCTFLTTSWVMFVFFAFFVRENKNRYVLAFLKSLVDCGLFEHIYLNFLPVGHTHCDIDQLFSRIAVWMRGRKPCKKFLESNSPKLTLHFMFMLTFCSTPSVHMG